MLIAVMSDKPDLSGHVPERFEESPCLLLIETEGGALTQAFSGETPAVFAQKIAEIGCEAVVCGSRIGKECFDPIADACVTRYDGAGLDILAAAYGGDRGTLPLIPEYEGGPGCASGTGDCNCGHDHE
jgi:predicted Fe-Mo cluster-binding NifX family protein